MRAAVAHSIAPGEAKAAARLSSHNQRMASMEQNQHLERDVQPPEHASTQKPSIGRIVIYTSKIDNGLGNDVMSPAIIIRTRSTCVEAVSKRWGPEPRTVTSASDPSVTHETSARPAEVADVLEDDYTVDLLVHGLGRDYREYNVKFGAGLGQWFWPPRV